MKVLLVAKRSTGDHGIFDQVCLDRGDNKEFYLYVSKPYSEDFTFNILMDSAKKKFVIHRVKVRQLENSTHHFETWPRIDGTTVLSGHQGVHKNNFHLHNDFLLPLYRLCQDIGTADNSLLFHGHKGNWKKRLALAYMVLEPLYTNHTTIFAGAILPACFHRYVVPKLWSLVHRRNLPFYDPVKRFDERWKPDFCHSFRDYIFQVLGIQPFTPSPSSLPRLTWVPRTSGPRVIRNADAVRSAPCCRAV